MYFLIYLIVHFDHHIKIYLHYHKKYTNNRISTYFQSNSLKYKRFKKRNLQSSSIISDKYFKSYI